MHQIGLADASERLQIIRTLLAKLCADSIAAQLLNWRAGASAGGDPRGHWDGKTLVIETTNFSRQNNVVGSDENLQLVERFTRVGPNDLEYVVTVSDPTVWTRSWTAKVRLTRTTDRLFEVACHEGNASIHHHPVWRARNGARLGTEIAGR